jgi:hypothetical protein
MPKKKRGSSLGRSSSSAKRKKAQRQSEEEQAENASSALAAYRARTQSVDHSEQERPSTSRESQSRWTQEREAERNVAARIMRRKDIKRVLMSLGRVAWSVVRQNSGNRRVEQARDTPARRVQHQATPNRAQEQERARIKRKENEEKKLLAFYAKLQEAEARLGQDEEPSVQSIIHKEKLSQLAENDFNFDIFLDNPIMAAGKKMHKELIELEWGACSNCQEYCFNTELDKYKGLCKLGHQNKAGRRAMFGPDNNFMPSQARECLQRLTPIDRHHIMEALV